MKHVKEGTIFGFAFNWRKDMSLVIGKTKSREEKSKM